MYFTHGDLCHNSCFGVITETQNLAGYSPRRNIDGRKLPHGTKLTEQSGNKIYFFWKLRLYIYIIFFFLTRLSASGGECTNVDFAQFMKALAPGSKIRHVRLTDRANEVQVCPSPYYQSTPTCRHQGRDFLREDWWHCVCVSLLASAGLLQKHNLRFKGRQFKKELS